MGDGNLTMPNHENQAAQFSRPRMTHFKNTLANRIARYVRTISYLKPMQVFGRIWFWVHRPTVSSTPNLPVRRHAGRWRQSPLKLPSLLSPSRFRFLNEEHELSSAADWNNPARGKLWLYNLHYFDNLNAEDSEARSEWHQALIERWVAENPVGKGNGWEPYTLSLRIVNWIKWAWAGNSLSGTATKSLALQARFLRRRLEWHILGNHLLANAKALIFAGLFFEGQEAKEWLAKGLSILERELHEQILADGGHFERSPMYHAQVLEDVLDIVNAFGMPNYHFRGNDKYEDAKDEYESKSDILSSRADKFKHLSRLEHHCRITAPKMLAWLDAMTHPDGEIALLNDSAFGGASAPATLAEYAERLGIEPYRASELVDAKSGSVRIRHLEATGYIRVDWGEMTAFLDTAPIGPDYLPGHAHADTLSFELSLGRQRVIVDSGVSCYGEGAERLRQRGTAAHNTVEIDGQDSSEVWSGFRVAQRAYPLNLRIDAAEGIISCAHDGYRRLPGQPLHRREWRFRKDGLEIRDTIDGVFQKAVGRIHFHPELLLYPLSGNNERGSTSVAFNAGDILLPDGQRIAWQLAKGGRARIVDTTWHPMFGVSIPNQCMEFEFDGPETVLNLTFKP